MQEGIFSWTPFFFQDLSHYATGSQMGTSLDTLTVTTSIPGLIVIYPYINNLDLLPPSLIIILHNTFTIIIQYVTSLTWVTLEPYFEWNLVLKILLTLIYSDTISQYWNRRKIIELLILNDDLSAVDAFFFSFLFFESDYQIIFQAYQGFG